MQQKKSLKEIGIRSVFAFSGNIILALGISILNIANVGVDPFTSLNVPLGGLLGLSLSVFQLIISVILLVGMYFFGKQYIGVGTVINMLITGFFIDLFTTMLTAIGFAQTTVMHQIVGLTAGILVFSFGISFYLAAEAGTAPYDAITPILVEKTKGSYRTVRIFQDTGFALAGFLLGGPVGVGTFVSAFLMGPFIQFWNDKISVRFVNNSINRLMKK